MSDATQNQLRHEQLRSAGERLDPGPDAHHQWLETTECAPIFQAHFGTVSQSRTYCTATNVQCHPWSGKGVADGD
jgi:hypothetical protein